MLFLIKNDEVWEKYEEIWDIIKNNLGIKFHSKPIYEKKHLKAKKNLMVRLEETFQVMACQKKICIILVLLA